MRRKVRAGVSGEFVLAGRRARGRPLSQIIPVGLSGLRTMLERFLDVGFSKFIVRPVAPPSDWGDELDLLAGAVGNLQT